VLINAGCLLGVLYGLYTFVPWIFVSKDHWALWFFASIVLTGFGWVCGSNLKDSFSGDPIEARMIRKHLEERFPTDPPQRRKLKERFFRWKAQRDGHRVQEMRK